MQIIDLDGHTQNWQLIGHKPNYNTKKSSLHIRARNLLSIVFPTLQVLEEVAVYIRKSDLVYLDFYIPLKRMCIETHGEQHYKFVQHYHGSALGFLKHKKRDRDKKEWCDLNGITFIELPFDESDNLWQNRLNQQKTS
jgi:hypothetical protein